MKYVRLYKPTDSDYWYLDIPPDLSPTGKRLRRSTKTKNKRVANSIRGQVEEGNLAALLGRSGSVRPRMAVESDYFDALEVSDDHSELTVERYRDVIPRVLDDCSWPPRTEELLAHWKGRMEREEIKPITASRERGFVHAFLQWATDRNWIQSNPCSDVPRFRTGRTAREVVLTDEQVRTLLAEITPKYRLLVRWMWATGMRVSECLALRWADIDRTVRVRGKGRKQRHLPVSDAMEGILGELDRQGERLFPFTRGSVWKAFKRARDRVGISKVSPHDLRHTFATNYLRAGGDIYQLSKILGHATVEITAEQYAHLVPGDLQAGMERLDVGRILAESPDGGNGGKGPGNGK